nr:lipopolysaccharide kinase InaA family protein [uncultured Desulfuromonas sp.]
MNETLIYINPEWKNILKNSHLGTFEQLWDLELTAVDEGNVGRGKNGWSKVCIFSFEDDEQQQHTVVIKRQSNYRSHTLRHPLIGIPTFLKEMDSIRRYEQANIPALKAVYCATRKAGNEMQAILVTEFLTGYQPLETIIHNWQEDGRPRRQECTATAVACGNLVKALHEHGLEHRCLFPKHIFLREADGQFDARLIDLEKTRWRPWFEARRVRDLTALARRSKQVANRDRVSFMRAYFGLNKLDTHAKTLWRQVARRIDKKRRS